MASSRASRAYPLRGLTGTAALLTTTMLTGVGPAWAQGAPPTVEEVVVTAQKRAEDLQDVPISVQAMGGEKLEQLVVSDFNDYAKFLPSVSFQTTAPGFSNVYMRGVASGGDGNHSGPLPSVGVYLDEQPITTIQGALDIHVYDMERVEALAGPQGTLYGASSQAGTLRLIANKPSTAGFAAGYDVTGTAIDHGGLGGSVEGFVNAPLSDRAAVRLVGWYVREGGYVDNVYGERTFPTSGVTINNRDRVKKDYNDVETVGARAALKIDLDDNWTITPTLMGQKEETNGLFAFDPNVGDLKVTHFYPEFSKDQWYQAALTIEGKIGSLDAIYAGAYMKRDVDYSLDYSDYSYFYDTLMGYGAYITDDFGNYINPSQYIQAKDGYTKESHEFRLSSDSEARFRFVAGLFYQKQTHDIQQRYRIDNLAAATEVPGWADTLWLTKQDREDKDYAAFLDMTYDITERLAVTGGIRFFKAENSLRGFFGFGTGYSSTTGVAACFKPAVTANAPCTNLDKATEETGNTHRINVTYKLDPDKLIYATWSTGYRPGGINRRSTLPPYKSDFLTNYEAGWKTSWLQNSLRFNGAIYLEEWEDFQFALLGANGLTEIKNAGQARIFGVEADVVWRASEELTLSGGFAYNDAQLTENYCGFVDANGNPETNCPNPEAPDGTELPVTPKLKANFTVRYAWSIDDLNLYVQGAVVHQTNAWTDLRIEEREIIGRMPGYTLVDLTAGMDRDDWSVGLFLTNAFDERANLHRYAECAEAVCGAQTYIVPTKPRTFGVRFGRKF
ncbi:TonB-dependent receptor [Caulobacter mirabilis]|uniref:TonB-dependent receptor n=1 Tax=Caulobacter mirabilis TaxID=69666 RepID=A0A2D2B1N8_9CAUL|nr:TonB-dependent receptor [Caulobacter mirabilis]ATQ44160.1 TonB-dependent receptor [Caulobacter mirabilis]